MVDNNINLLESLIEFSGSRFDRISKTEVVFTKVCRTCLCETTANNLDSNLFLTNDPNGVSVTIKDMMEASTGLQINTEDKLPCHICDGCLKAIEAAYSFRIHSQRIDEILKGFLRQVYTIKEETGDENEMTSIGIPIKSEKIDESTDTIQIEDYQVTYVKEGFVNSSFQCDLCNMNFSNQMDLDKHNDKHGLSRGKRKLFKCGICSKEYSFRNGLHNHLMITHVHKREIKCSVCGKKFKKRESLRHHKKTFCIAPATITKLNKADSEITVHNFGESMNVANLIIEIKNFSCSLCEGSFKFEIDFLNHMQKHSSEKRCPYCKKFFGRAINLESHIRSHTGEKPFICPICSSRFSATRTFRKHIKSHAERKAYSCNNCGNRYLSERELLRHLKTHDKERISLNLSETENVANKTNEYNEPDTASGIDSIKAINLPTTSSSNNQWVNNYTDQKYELEHRDISTSTAVMQSICKTEPDEMETVVIKKENVEVLYTAVHPTPDHTFVEKQEKSQGDYALCKNNTKQLNKEKSEDVNSAFNIINEPISDDEQSSKQDSSHAEAMVYGRFTCAVPVCKVEFKYYRDIINHYTSQHCVGPPPFNCPVCAIVFPLKLDVRRHLKSHLTCEYKCPYCPKAYWQLRDLNMHLRTHTGERPFKCPKCHKCFKQRSALKVHIKTHSICKEYKCSICAKEFFSYNGLFLHTKGHTEIKELQCQFCSKQFPTKSRLRRHQSGICGSRTSTKS